jgi:hypothetical protein
MNFSCPLLWLIVLFLGATSCTRIYSTGSSNTPITIAPINTKEKGDLNLSAEFLGYNVMNTASDFSSYNFIGINAFRLNTQYAVSDNSTIGMSYSFNAKQPFTGHTFNGMYNYSKNYNTKNSKRESQYGFDVLAGVQFQHNNNFVEVTDYLYDTYIFFDTTSGLGFFYYDVEAYPLGYYKLKQNTLRLYVQPSFTYENRLFELFFGASIGYQHNLIYEPKLSIAYQSYIEDITENNPLVYYNNNKTFVFGEPFWGFGIGPEFCRFVWLGGFGRSSDQLQPLHGFASLGIRSNFNTKRSKTSD